MDLMEMLKALFGGAAMSGGDPGRLPPVRMPGAALPEVPYEDAAAGSRLLQAGNMAGRMGPVPGVHGQDLQDLQPVSGVHGQDLQNGRNGQDLQDLQRRAMPEPPMPAGRGGQRVAMRFAPGGPESFDERMPDVKQPYGIYDDPAGSRRQDLMALIMPPPSPRQGALEYAAGAQDWAKGRAGALERMDSRGPTDVDLLAMGSYGKDPTAPLYNMARADYNYARADKERALTDPMVERTEAQAGMYGARAGKYNAETYAKGMETETADLKMAHDRLTAELKGLVRAQPVNQQLIDEVKRELKSVENRMKYAMPEKPEAVAVSESAINRAVRENLTPPAYGGGKQTQEDDDGMSEEEFQETLQHIKSTKPEDVQGFIQWYKSQKAIRPR